MTDSDATQGDNMSPAEFAKLMGAYPQPAENPLPTYGGYMDNSPANFSWVQNNDYFGAEEDYGWVITHKDSGLRTDSFRTKSQAEKYRDELKQNKTLRTGMKIVKANSNDEAIPSNILNYLDEKSMGAETIHEKGDYRIIAEEDYYVSTGGVFQEREDFDDLMELSDTHGMFTISLQKKVMGGWKTIDAVSGVVPHYGDMEEVALMELGIPNGLDVETFEAEKLHPGLHRHKGKIKLRKGWDECQECDDLVKQDEINFAYLEGYGNATVCDACVEKYQGFQRMDDYIREKWTSWKDWGEKKDYSKKYVPVKKRHEWGESEIARLNYDGIIKSPYGAETFNGLSAEEYYAEMEELTDGVASITNRFGDGVGIIQVDDEDLEDVSVEITDGDGDVVYEGILGDENTPEIEEDDYYFSENKKKSSILPMALGIAGAIFAYQPVMDFLARKTKKEEKMAETPELIENPNTGNLDPAQYEELVVESTGYAVDVIPQVLDGSFMGSRFAALPTERYVEYSDPGIGAHTDIAMNRDEIYLEPEMAMVQASESVKESQAPGQSPYNSVDGEENRDFDMRVLKETQVISLDPAVKPFIPQSMSGYTGNANTPPSVYDKMFNIGVLGQTPAFVPGSGDIGSSHTGSRSAIPNSLGVAGSVGGPLSDKVNANYTDGTTSMSLAQWAIENTVSQSSDTEAVVIDRSSGQMKRVRRV
jgi:hypothetical protein